MVVERNRAVFTEAPTAVPDGNVDVSGGGRWKIWQNAGTKIDAPILGNGDLLAAVAGDGRYPQFWFTTNDFWQMESAANWEFFHDNSSAKCDPAVYGAGVCHGRNDNNIDKFRRREMFSEKLGGCG